MPPGAERARQLPENKAGRYSQPVVEGAGYRMTGGRTRNCRQSRGGAITVESKPSKGSLFPLYLPGKGTLPRSRIDDPGTPGKGDSRKARQRVLLVDDESLVLMSVRRALERLGYEVEAVKDGTDALELFTGAPDSFDVVITDQTMPRMTGAELAAKILHIRPDIPVILSTVSLGMIKGTKNRKVKVYHRASL